MSRSRKTDPQTALMNAMQLFWCRGYGAVGTRQIDDQTGITRFTLQQTYGGKKALFLQALDAYLDLFEAHVAPPDQASSMDEIANWFLARTAPQMLADSARNGCFLLNTIAEFGTSDTDVNTRIDRYFEMQHQRFGTALEGLKTSGQLPTDFDIARHVEILTATAIGMNVTIRARSDNAAGRALAEACAALIGSWGSAIRPPRAPAADMQRHD